MKIDKSLYLGAIGVLLLLLSAYSYRSIIGTGDSAADSIVSPRESIKRMIVEKGFEVKLVAAEPLVSTPVAMDFDSRGRMWVVEMEGYMTDIDGSEEDQPNGKIVILEDRDKDGEADQRLVFLDSLQLPRALCLIEGGILVAEPPRLWYIPIHKDKPGKRVLVDENYTEGGNVEAQANGLFRAMDNWIYSGGSDKRYRKSGDTWLTERTHLRGQWGLTQDNYGRLYYNNNSQNLLGDYFSPGLGAANENMQRVRGFNERIITDNRVYPARPTPGVNRGYKENVLDSAQRLLSFTAACGPALYRGGLFAASYDHNVFVAEPAANLIKRNILQQEGFTTAARQAYQGREFLASTDERFRPVSLYNGPDGALYVVDMYRGIIQHKSFLTDYLKEQIQQRSLFKPLNCGRIYKIVPQGSTTEPVTMPSTGPALIALLSHSNGWVRDRAQQMIVDSKSAAAAPALRNLLKTTKSPLTSIHAMWAMEGLGALTESDLAPLLQHPDWKVRAQAVTALSSVLSASNYRSMLPLVEKLAAVQDTLLAPYLAFQAGRFARYDQQASDALLLQLVKRYPQSVFTTDAIISTLKGREPAFYQRAKQQGQDSGAVFYSQLRKVLVDIRNNEKNRDANVLRKEFPRGASLFRTTCLPCHGADGNGVPSLAPPLNRSEWVTGDKTKLIAIILHGLTGPVQVNNKIYQAPEINGDMPGIGANKDIVDEDIAQLSSYIRKSWSNEAGKIEREEVIQIRKKFAGRQNAFTVKELDAVRD